MEWPKKMRELEGATVLTTRHLRTRRGVTAPAGTRCTIIGIPKTLLRLRADKCPHCCVQFEIVLGGPRDFKLSCINLLSLKEGEL